MTYPPTPHSKSKPLTLEPSLVLGCGYFGGNSPSDNVVFSHLSKIKRLAFFWAAENTLKTPHE
jgi:hypothetical protein